MDNYQSKPKSGPVTKHQKQKRRDEVYRLHFEYGYSARKISDILKIPRNTINADVNYWYDITATADIHNPETIIISNLQRLETQRVRIREKLDDTDDLTHYIALERLLLEIDIKIINVRQKMADSIKRVWDLSISYSNKWFAQNNKDQRFMTNWDRITLSESSKRKVDEIIEQDKINVR
ncbi:MAG: hypothetical protein MAG458_00552 [Nitrosopumilus sp.]|nr:hypothetical protein [Nitrosopumilus sp.]